MNIRRILLTTVIYLVVAITSGCGETPVEKAFDDGAGLNKQQTAAAVQVLDSINIKNVQKVKHITNNEYDITAERYDGIRMYLNDNKSISKVTTQGEAVLYQNNGVQALTPNKIDSVYLSQSEYDKYFNRTLALAIQRLKYPDSVDIDYERPIIVTRADDKVAASFTIKTMNDFGGMVLIQVSAAYTYPTGEVLEFYLD